MKTRGRLGVVLALGSCLGLLGCGSRAPAPLPPERPAAAPTAATPTTDDWRARAEAMRDRLKPGMTTDEVEGLLGQPSYHQTTIHGETVTLNWHFPVSSNVYVGVVFDKNERLVYAQVMSHFPVQ